MKTATRIETSLFALVAFGFLSSTASANPNNQDRTEESERPKLVASIDANQESNVPRPEDESMPRANTELRDLIARNPIRFGSSGVKIGPNEQQRLRRLIVPILLAPTATSIVVEGHTDLHGRAEVNDKVALKRAEDVRDYLVLIGLPAEMVTVRSAGARHPLVGDMTVAANRVNRRVELHIDR